MPLQKDTDVAVKDRKPEPKSEPFVFVPTPFRRFSQPDIAELGPWLYGRLKPEFDHLNERSFPGWLGGLVSSNDYLFLRTARCVGLMQAVANPLRPYKDAREVFVFSTLSSEDQDDLHEGITIYKEFYRWAEMIGAREVLVDVMSDFTRDAIRYGMRKLYPTNILIARTKNYVDKGGRK